ncbi:hypothetical protein OOK58_42170 [Streptomyces sp. NBC_01728]|uniref:hypothetical protein n=1 Tax=unclassified Streptomyces TaxID=2593676 RepID=UPI00224F2CB1|nr:MULTISPECIES: hypothetical protein [unclassified Streptomyces]MCX4458522.1 hypothetical protein [Streptomyces sp. NBC_01719]MCX4497879.1 hypothetical protein [Streptomyces sp. NBC_01728]
MTETPETPQHWQPGTRRRKVKIQRAETTVIDGRPSTRMVPDEVWVTLPPRDWDEIIRRGVTAVAVVVTVLAAAGTTASVGGLLSHMLHPGVAYAVGVVFTSSWLACLGVEHIERVDAGRAQRARIGGWAALIISMGAVITYGHTLDLLPAGVVGSCLDLLAKGLWFLVMGLDAVELDAGVAHWVAEEEQHMAGRFLLGTRLARLNRRAVQMRAGGPEFEAAEAILAQASGHQAQQILSGPHPDPSGQPVPTPAQQPAPVQQPATPAPVQQPAPTSLAITQAASVPPVPSVAQQAPADTSGAASGQAPDPSAQQTQPPVPPVTPMGPSIAQTVRLVLSEDWGIDDEDLVERVRQVHGDRPKLHDTVMTYRRKEVRKRKAS